MDVRDLIIAGGGPAGLTAAIYAARADLRPLVVEGMLPGGQLTTTTDIENFPGFEAGIQGPELMRRMRAQAERFGAQFAAAAVESADFSARPLRLTLDSGETLAARAVIVATGANPLYLGLESERALLGRGVSACATCDGAFHRNRPVAVVGGGDTAMEEAVFLARLAAHVTLIHRRDAFRASRIMTERVLGNPKISVAWNAVVEEVLDVARGEVTGARLRDVRTGARSQIEISGLFVAIGHAPNTAAFAGQLPMDERGYLVTHGARTAVEGVFAAGDVQDALYRQAVTAAGSGCAAALEAERYLAAQH